MAKIKMETRLAVSPDMLWKTIGGFNALPAWHPGIEKSDSDGEGKGAMRTLKLVGGGTILERMEHLSEKERRYSYSIIDSPLPVSNYVAEIHVADNGDGSSNIEWSSDFQPAKLPENEAIKTIEGIYQAGFDNLKKMFGG